MPSNHSFKPHSLTPFGSVMLGRDFRGEKYRFGFNGKEKNSEFNSDNYDFGARIYDGRIGRWFSVDPLTIKYPSYSPFHFGYCNPLITIDLDGNENIVVVGNQGRSPESDKIGSDYRYGVNSRHFLEAGLNEALRLKQNNTSGEEGTALLVYTGNYAKNELDYYKKRATEAGVSFIEVKSSEEIANYINKKTPSFTSDQKNNERENDLITEFSYIGHGWSNALLPDYNTDFNYTYDPLNTSMFEKESFDRGCNVNLNSCGSGFAVMDDFVNRLTNGEVTGYRVTVIWGGEGLGTTAPFDKWYYPPGDSRRDSSDRPTVPENQRTRTENGSRKD